MALPSAVTLTSVAFVLVAGAGFAAVTTLAGEDQQPDDNVTRPTDQRETPDPTTPATPTGPDRTNNPDRGDKTKTPGKEGKKKRRDAVPQVFVEVYNNSGITGLAAEKAAILQGSGWNVAATDNWYGDIPENTVYYPDGLRAEALQLAKVVDITRLHAAVSPMQFDRLTVIFVSY